MSPPRDRHPLTAAAVVTSSSRWDVRWLPVVRRLGFTDVAAYLVDRHEARQHTVRAIATETGVSRSAVESALARHGIRQIAHASSRAHRDERAAAVAARFDHRTIDAYFADRRAAGLSWRAIAAECGRPGIWVRRQAGLAT